jgi:hypothetical protein
MKGTVLLILAALIPAPLLAADLRPGHSDNWCADSVDFAMRTVERRDIGKSQEYILQAIQDSPIVFAQQYPDLEASDMQGLVVQVFKNHWSRFAAARAIARSCAEERGAATPETQMTIPASRSANWCADAVDFAMGAAQNRELGYTLEMLSVSVDRNPGYYNRLFVELSANDLKSIVGTVYQQEWTRFGAAQKMTESCISF